MEPMLRSTLVFKQEAEDIGFQWKDIAEYVKEQQALDRQERADWRDAQLERDAKFYVKEKKRADEIQLAKIQAEAEEKKRADEIKIQIAQIEAAKEQAKIEAAKEQARIEVDKELKIKEMELQAQQAQATASSATTHPLVIKMPSPRSYHPL